MSSPEEHTELKGGHPPAGNLDVVYENLLF